MEQACHAGGRGFESGYVIVVGALFALTLMGCGGESTATGTTGAPARPPTAPASSTSTGTGAPSGDAAPAQLQGTWKLVAKENPDKGLHVVISERHYPVVTRLAHGDLAVKGNEIAFFNAAICGLQLPDGVGRYRWTIEGKRLHFELIGEEPCGGRAAIFEDATYEPVG